MALQYKIIEVIIYIVPLLCISCELLCHNKVGFFNQRIRADNVCVISDFYQLAHHLTLSRAEMNVAGIFRGHSTRMTKRERRVKRWNAGALSSRPKRSISLFWMHRDISHSYRT